MEAGNDLDDTGGDGSAVVHGYEQLRARALGGQPDGWRLGLGVLQQRGVAAWLRLRQATVPTTSPPPPARAALPIGAGVDRELVGLLASMAAKVTAAHLARTAYLHVRQSTLRQVLTNTESATGQYALRQKAIALGWPADRIVTIDTDQGQSGGRPQSHRVHGCCGPLCSHDQCWQVFYPTASLARLPALYTHCPRTLPETVAACHPTLTGPTGTYPSPTKPSLTGW